MDTRWIRRLSGLALALAAALSAGCGGPRVVAGRMIENTNFVHVSRSDRQEMDQQADSAERRECGKIWMLDGMMGDVTSVQQHCRWGLMAADLPWAMEIWPWQHGWRSAFLREVIDIKRNRQQANRLADEIRTYRREYPGRPVRLIGASAGAAVITFALEKLAPDTVTDVVLLSCAVSTDYDMTRALSAVKRRLIVVHSPHDWFVLGLGTSIAGSVDRRHGISAGMTGFRWEADRLTDSQRRQYAKLTQIRWRPWMTSLGYFGEHVTSSSTSFAARVLAPMLAETPPSP